VAAIAGACSQEQLIPNECQWSEIASVRSIETRNGDEGGIQNSNDSPTTAVGGDQSAGRQGCRATGIPRRQAGLANREADMPTCLPAGRAVSQ